MKNNTIKSQADFYRFYPMPGNLIAQLKQDKIDLTVKSSIEKILTIRKSHKEIISEQYFNLYKINFALNNKLWASDITSFNDMHEQIAWIEDEELLQKSRKELAKKQGSSRYALRSQEQRTGIVDDKCMRHDWTKSYPTMGAVCFCKVWNGQLMWGHYANGHNGICIGYKISDRLKSAMSENKIIIQEYNFPENQSFYFLFGSVTYVEKPQTWSPVTREHHKKQYEMLCQQSPITSKLIGESDYMVIAANMFTKSDAWQNEEEQRMVFLDTPYRNVDVKKLVSDDKGSLHLEIAEVICGNKVDNQVINILKNSTHSGVKFKKAMPKGGTFEYGLIKV